MSCFKLFIPKDALDEPYRAAPGDLSALPSVPDVLPNSSVERQLKLCASVTPPDDAPLSELITRSSAFPLSFPVNTVRCSHLLNKPDLNEDILQRNANSAYPVLHEKALYLLVSFLDFKRQWGSSVEQDLYGDMDVLQLIDRLLQRRSAAFVGSSDRFLLQDGTKGHGGWDSVGTVEEREPLQLRNCLSYDEMKLSALLSVSSQTVFINDGRRNNKGIETEELESFQRLGVIVGLIGTRMERENVMEYQEIMVTQQQNVEERGYGHLGSSESPAFRWRQMWANFYGAQPNFPLYSEAQEVYNTCRKQGAQRYSKLFAEEYFDNLAYQRRLAVSFETLLLEAESRAEVAGTTAFVHVVGIGLGVWSLSPHQDRQFLDAFGSCVQRLLPVLGRVSDLRFAWFSETEIRGVGHGGRIGHIRVHFSKDEPQMRLKDPRQLLVVSYAWDGNSLPGNEFWFGEKTASGDPAAACCSQVAELHTAKINSRVCAYSLRIASPQWGVLHVAEYASRMLSVTTNSARSAQ